MGQRLNIEIKISDRVVANSYFHWSAYTISSIELVQKIIDNFEDVIEENPILYGVRLLELTGAGLERASVDWAYANIPNFSLRDDDGIRYKYRICDDRNDGLIAISEENMNSTRSWQEGYVCIDINNRLVDFNVFFEYTKKELLDWEVKESGDFDFDYPINAIPFDKFSSFGEYVKNLSEKDRSKDSKAYKIDEDYYISLIE